jgi:23S rRNA pseudouridine2605 synthase
VVEQPNETEVGVQTHSNKNQIIKRAFEHFGYKVVKMDRVLMGGLTKKDLPRGKWRHLTEREIGALKMLK